MIKFETNDTIDRLTMTCTWHDTPDSDPQSVTMEFALDEYLVDALDDEKRNEYLSTKVTEMLARLGGALMAIQTQNETKEDDK